MDEDQSDNESLPPPANGHAVPAAAAQGADNGNGAAQAPPQQRQKQKPQKATEPMPQLGLHRVEPRLEPQQQTVSVFHSFYK